MSPRTKIKARKFGIDPFSNYRRLEGVYKPYFPHLTQCYRCRQRFNMILLEEASDLEQEILFHEIHDHDYSTRNWKAGQQVTAPPRRQRKPERQPIQRVAITNPPKHYEPKKPLDSAAQTASVMNMLAANKPPKDWVDPMPNLDNMTDDELEAFNAAQSAASTPIASQSETPTGEKENGNA